MESYYSRNKERIKNYQKNIIKTIRIKLKNIKTKIKKFSKNVRKSI